MLLSEFHLYRTPRGVVAVSGEKMRLMALLRDGSMEFGEIVEFLGRDKSTVSVHLRELEEGGLVSSHSGLRDRRVRVYRCEARRVLSAGDGRDPGVSLARMWAASLGQPLPVVGQRRPEGRRSSLISRPHASRKRTADTPPEAPG